MILRPFSYLSVGPISRVEIRPSLSILELHNRVSTKRVAITDDIRHTRYTAPSYCRDIWVKRAIPQDCTYIFTWAAGMIYQQSKCMLIGPNRNASRGWTADCYTPPGKRSGPELEQHRDHRSRTSTTAALNSLHNQIREETNTRLIRLEARSLERCAGPRLMCHPSVRNES